MYKLNIYKEIQGSCEARGRRHQNNERQDRERNPRQEERRSPIRGVISTILKGFTRGK